MSIKDSRESGSSSSSLPASLSLLFVVGEVVLVEETERGLILWGGQLLLLNAKELLLAAAIPRRGCRVFTIEKPSTMLMLPPLFLSWACREKIVVVRSRPHTTEIGIFRKMLHRGCLVVVVLRADSMCSGLILIQIAIVRRNDFFICCLRGESR